MGLSLQDRVAALPVEQRKEWLSTLPDYMIEEMERGEWWWVARPEQVPPPGNWFVCLALAGRGFGKALATTTRIPTPTGWAELGQLRPGDEVLDMNGLPTKITWKSPVYQNRNCFRVAFSDGSSVIADGDHQWVARTMKDRRKQRPWRTVTTLQMLDDGLTSTGGANWQMPVNASLDLPEMDLPVAPYILGYWLGDGDSASSTFTIGPKDAAEVLALLAEEGLLLLPARHSPMRYAPAALPPAREESTGRMLPNGSLTSILKELGVLGSKHIPTEYLRASRAQRQALLEGLIDSDGHVRHATGLIEITSVKYELAKDIAELARSLGHRVTMSNERAMLNGVDVGPKYRITWVMRSGGGRLDRKRLPDRSHLGQSERINSRYVRSINPVETVPVCCISVDSPTETYLATDRFLVTHNSRAGSEWVVNQALKNPFDRYGTPTEWLVIAETLSDARTICMEGPAGILRVLERRKIKHRFKQSPRPMVLFPNGSKIYTEGADDPDVGRGYNASGAWLDEICIAKDEPVLTRHGNVPVQDVRAGDEVRTRAGWAKVAYAGLTKADVEVWEVSTGHGTVRLTPDHRVWTEVGWKAVQDLGLHDVVSVRNHNILLKAQISGLRRLPGTTNVYDITVDGDHPEFFAGSGAILVHNCKWKYPKASWDAGIMPSLRADLVGDHPRAFVTTTPKPVDLIQDWARRNDGSIHVIRGSTFDNSANLSQLVVQELRKRYDGTMIGRQELYGELVEGFEGALFSRLDIENNRRDHVPDNLLNIVVGVDPSLTGEDDEMGIVVAARDRDNHMYVLADRSIMGVGRTAALDAWRVVAEWGADTLVCEVNLGKRWMQQVFTDAYYELVEQGVFERNTKPPLKGIDTKIGKRTRAEPVGMRMEQGRMHLVGVFPTLEDQMVTFTGWGNQDSPDRLDALVHACRFLMEGEKKQARITSPHEMLSTTLRDLWATSGSYQSDF